MFFYSYRLLIFRSNFYNNMASIITCITTICIESIFCYF
nr:MAG TPA: hypothetical protein [Caudoviricetes sp.]